MDEALGSSSGDYPSISFPSSVYVGVIVGDKIGDSVVGDGLDERVNREGWVVGVGTPGAEMISPGGGSLQRGGGEVLLDDKILASNGMLGPVDVGSSPVGEGEGKGLVTTGGNELETAGGSEGEAGGDEGVTGGNEGVTGGSEGVTVVEESDGDDGGGDGATDGEGDTRSAIAQGRRSSCPLTRDLLGHPTNNPESSPFLSSRLDGSPESIRTLDGRRIIIVPGRSPPYKKGEEVNGGSIGGTTTVRDGDWYAGA